MKRLFALVVVAVAACAPTLTVSKLNTPPHALTRRSPDEVQVFSSQVPTNVVDLYRIDVSGGDETKRMPAARERAASLGCEGLVVNGGSPDRTTVTGATAAQGYLSTTCFVFTAEASPDGKPDDNDDAPPR